MRLYCSRRRRRFTLVLAVIRFLVDLLCCSFRSTQSIVVFMFVHMSSFSVHFYVFGVMYGAVECRAFILFRFFLLNEREETVQEAATHTKKT